MAFLYELAVLGTPSDAQLNELEQLVSQAVQLFGLRLGHEVAWLVCPEVFNPEQQKTAAAVFFGGKDTPQINLPRLLQKAIPVLPVVSDFTKVQEEIPVSLRPMNCLAYNEGGAQRVATALLDRRRIFILQTS